jgi:Family of unknown function (DUF6113)
MAAPSGSRSGAITAAAYVALLLLGAAEGMIGSFQYSRLAPVGAILLCVVLLATCLLAAWGMQSVSGAFVPALGWLVASFVMAMPRSTGSVIIASTAAGEWYLYGGTLSAVIALVASFVIPWHRPRPRPR